MIDHVFDLFDILAPRIFRELAILKLQLGARDIYVDELIALHTSLPIEKLHPRDRTALVDEGFRRWTFDKEETRQKLPPTFAAALALLEGTPTPEVIDLAKQLLREPGKDIIGLTDFVTPHWVLRIYGDDEVPEYTSNSFPVDTTTLESFFEEYQGTFSQVTDVAECRWSPEYPGVVLRLGFLHYGDGESSAIHIHWLVINEGVRFTQNGDDVIEYLKQLALKHGVVLTTFPAIDDEEGSQRFRLHGFSSCQDQDPGAHRRLEWPKCQHANASQI